MEKKRIGFFEEEEGAKSSMRLMSFSVYLLLAMVDFMILRFSYYNDNAYDMWFTVFMIGINLIFLIAIFYPKYLQKIIELGADKIGVFKDAIAPIAPKDLAQKSEGQNVQ
ncbi:MAG: hypothetical protein WC998_09830 [Candidatus Paceibacterota bacterium]|jgi:uncharacterized membrane protein